MPSPLSSSGHANATAGHSNSAALPMPSPSCSSGHAPAATGGSNLAAASPMHSPFGCGLSRILTHGCRSQAPAAAGQTSSAVPEGSVDSVGNMGPAAAAESAAQTVPEQQLEDALAACRIHRYESVWGWAVRFGRLRGLR